MMLLFLEAEEVNWERKECLPGFELLNKVKGKMQMTKRKAETRY